VSARIVFPVLIRPAELAALAGDADLVGDLDIDIDAATDTFVGLAVTEIAMLRGEVGGRHQG
jgi:hypothetical protein